jgi:hypothetical protein
MVTSGGREVLRNWGRRGAGVEAWSSRSRGGSACGAHRDGERTAAVALIFLHESGGTPVVELRKWVTGAGQPCVLEPGERWCGGKKMVKWGSSGAFLPGRERKGGGWSGVAQGGGSRGGVRCCAHVERKGVRHRQWHRSGGGSGRSGTCRMKRVKSWVHGPRLLWARPTRNSKFFNLFKRISKGNDLI